MCSDASSNVRARAVKDYCNTHDLSHISFREGDLVTVRRYSDTVYIAWYASCWKGQGRKREGMGHLGDPPNTIYTRLVTNTEVRHISGVWLPASLLYHNWQKIRLRFFGHIVRCPPNEDHHRSVTAAIQKPSSDRKRPSSWWILLILFNLRL